MGQLIKFSIQNLLSKKENGNISGPMSPLLFAQEIALQGEFKFNRLARVWFEDERIHQIREDGGFTGHDTLIIGSQYTNDFWLSMWVDSGVGGIPVAMCYQSDMEIILTPVYSKHRFEIKLTIEQLSEIFQSIFNSPEIVSIKTENELQTI
jgi:hypothetical protein